MGIKSLSSQAIIGIVIIAIGILALLNHRYLRYYLGGPSS